MSGTLLSTQIIYSGKRRPRQTMLFHMRGMLPTRRITGTTLSMVEYAETVLVQYFDVRIGIVNGKAVYIFDVFTEHQMEQFLNKLKVLNILLFFKQN